MNLRRELLLALGLSMLASPQAEAAAPPTGNRRLGVLLFDRREDWQWLAQELRVALAELGWVEGKNLRVEWRFADGDATRLQLLASELVRSGVDAILTRGTSATRALQRATKTIPIVTGVGDPVGAGFARSFARPGSNITGLSWASDETYRKQVELLRGMVPGLARLVIVLKADQVPFASALTRSVEMAAREAGLAPEIAWVASAADLPAALRRDRGPGVSAAFVFSLGADIEPKQVANIALRDRLPTMFGEAFYVDAGGLMSYRLGWENATERNATQLDKVFRGASPAQIPFELPTRSDFVINKATAKALGLNIPPAILLRADRVIE